MMIQTMMTGVWKDVRYGLRLFRREPGATIAAAGLIALGIAATTTMFSVVYGVLVKPLPWLEPERLVRLEERRGDRPGRLPWVISNGTYHAWRDHPATIVSKMLYGVSPHDALTFAAVPVLAAVAALACAIPARRAATIDPWRALRGSG
jgi:ABC-type antimicrobial peptide transport system permease subunit